MKNPIRSDTNWGIDISFACGSIYTEMKNLAEKDIEAVEELPSRAKVRPPDGGWGHYNDDYPWNKVDRFLHSRVGKKWDDVYSELLVDLQAPTSNMTEVG